MTNSEELIAKYAAQVLQAKRVSSLTFEELELTKLLVEHGYLRRESNGFNGTMTSKAMIRDPLQTFVNLTDFKGSNVRKPPHSFSEQGIGTSHTGKGSGRYGTGRFN